MALKIYSALILSFILATSVTAQAQRANLIRNQTTYSAIDEEYERRINVLSSFLSSYYQNELLLAGGEISSCQLAGSAMAFANSIPRTELLRQKGEGNANLTQRFLAIANQVRGVIASSVEELDSDACADETTYNHECCKKNTAAGVADTCRAATGRKMNCTLVADRNLVNRCSPGDHACPAGW